MKSVIELAQEAAGGMLSYDAEDNWKLSQNEVERFAKLVAEEVRRDAAEKVGKFAQKWWSIHCDSNKHMDTTRKAHDDFCALQIEIKKEN